MYVVKGFAIEVWPGEIRIHQDYETEGQQTIELSAAQIPAFCEALMARVDQAEKLGQELEARDQAKRMARAMSKG
ncbi:hypothetical protein D3C84_1156940 [compost metagenome]